MGLYYAKPLEGEKGTYEYHISACLDVARDFLAAYREKLATFCVKVGLSFEELETLCLRAVLFHDTGKLGSYFQERMRNIVAKGADLPGRYFRHELISAAVLYQYYIKHGGASFPFDVWAVLGHHARIEKSWSSFRRDSERPEPDSIDAERYRYALVPGVDDVAECARELSLSAVFRDGEDENWVKRFLEKFGDKYLSEFGGNLGGDSKKHEQRRAVAAIVRGVLCYSDWQASSEPGERLNVAHSQNNVTLENRIRSNVGAGYSKRPFQAACEAVDGNVLAIAPTGSGKTEGALLWATKSGPGKILFLMPTKVTSNSLYERMKKYFKPKDCGLSHSGAGVYLTVKHENQKQESPDRGKNLPEEEEAAGDALKYLRKYKAFMAPVTVATVDQLLTANFNMGDWYFKELATVGASVIFDEIHAYQPFTLALITESIERIKKMGGRVMVMSATMPRALRRHFQGVLEVDTPIVAEELMERINCSWEYRQGGWESFDGEIGKALESGRKVAIVVNTVARAQEVFRHWRKLREEKSFKRDFNIMCYHSTFIMRDREEKESVLLDKDELGRPKSIDLLIATQAIEVSLDISFDLMYSECAPLDSLIQRAGRCNRYGRSTDARFIVFPVSEIAAKYVYKDADTILTRTEKVLQQHVGTVSERKLGEMLEEVYRDFEPCNADFYEARKIVQEIERHPVLSISDEIDFSEEKVTRRIDYLKVSIIPHEFYGEVEALWKSDIKEDRWKIALYEVPVGANLLIRNKIPPYGKARDLEFLNIREVEYSRETGIHLSADSGGYTFV